MNFFDAKKIYIEEYFKGRRRNLDYTEEIFPYSIVRHQTDTFIKAQIEIKEIVELYEVDEALVDKYVGMIIDKNEFSPIWLSIGKKLKNGEIVRRWHKKFEAVDGNHRMAAYKKLKYKSIGAFMPKSHYDLYIRIKNGNENS